MHILQLANFHGPRSGGIRVALDQLGRRYVAAGHSVTLVVPAATPSRAACGPHVTVRVGAPRVPGLGGYRVIVDRTSIRDIVEHDRPDVIELSDKTTLVSPAHAARRSGIPVVLLSHERVDRVVETVVPAGRRLHRPVRRYNEWLLRHVDAVVCASLFAAAEFDDVRHDRPVLLVPLGVDLHRFRPLLAPRRCGIAQLVSVVRLSPEKRPEMIVGVSRELVRRRVPHRFRVYGDGPMRAALERSARRLPVEFMGHVTCRDALATAMAGADVGIAPGPAETFGLAALELMASGTPVVVPARGALPEVLADGGLAVEPTAAAFADAIVALLADDPVVAGARARHRAEEFDWSRTTASLLDLYSSLTRPWLDPTPQPGAPTTARSYL